MKLRRQFRNALELYGGTRDHTLLGYQRQLDIMGRRIFVDTSLASRPMMFAFADVLSAAYTTRKAPSTEIDPVTERDERWQQLDKLYGLANGVLHALQHFDCWREFGIRGDTSAEYKDEYELRWLRCVEAIVQHEKYEDECGGIALFGLSDQASDETIIAALRDVAQKIRSLGE